MKQLSTKSIGSLLIATATVIRDVGKRASQKHLDRVLQRHDRKGDIRASILGMSPQEFRDALKRHSFDELIRVHGFKSQHEFMLALRGRLLNELLHRGWSRHRINSFVNQKLTVTA